MKYSSLLLTCKEQIALKNFGIRQAAVTTMGVGNKAFLCGLASWAMIDLVQQLWNTDSHWFLIYNSYLTSLLNYLWLNYRKMEIVYTGYNHCSHYVYVWSSCWNICPNSSLRCEHQRRAVELWAIIFILALLVECKSTMEATTSDFSDICIAN